MGQHEVATETVDACDAKSSVIRRNMQIVAFMIGMALSLSGRITPPISLALGLALALTFQNPFVRQSRHISALLLKSCVVLLGFSMDLMIVLRTGVNGFGFAAGTITLTLVIGSYLGKYLTINPRVSTLISAGTAICGGSAIAAVGSVIGAAEAEMTVAIGTVFLLNALALYLFPILGNLMHLSQNQFGIWAGVAIHDISSVVGAASHYGPSALLTATSVKLSRSLWIVPVALLAQHQFRTHSLQAGLGGKTGSDQAAFAGSGSERIQIPWFIGLFLLASISRSLIPWIVKYTVNIANISVLGLTVTLFLVGSGLSKKTLHAVGWKPLIQGITLWIMISVGSLLVILLSVH